MNVQTTAQQLAALALKNYVTELRAEYPHKSTDDLVALAIARMLLTTNNVDGFTVGKHLQQYH